MTDPLSEVVTLLQPTARFSKRVEGSGHWRIRREGQGDPFYAAVLEGTCELSIDGRPPLTLLAGDFVLIPAVQMLENASAGASQDIEPSIPTRIGEDHFRIGNLDGPVNLRVQLGQFGEHAHGLGTLSGKNKGERRVGHALSQVKKERR